MTPQKRVVAITGANGFIGSQICKTLHRSGLKTRVLIRNPEKSASAFTSSEVVRGDLHDFTALAHLTDGADYLIHCAGRVRGTCARQFDHDNAVGTENIARVASNSDSLTKCIYISSLSARHPELSFYAASKFKGEQVLTEYAANSWQIIRPPAVYGPGDKEMRPLLDSISRGILWLPGDIDNRFSLLHIYDLCNLVSAVLKSSVLADHIIEPDDGTPGGYSWGDIRNIASAYFERNIYTIPVPRLILASVAHMNVLFSRALRGTPMLTPGKVQELTYSNWVVNQDKSTLDWSPEYNFTAGLSTLYR